MLFIARDYPHRSLENLIGTLLAAAVGVGCLAVALPATSGLFALLPAAVGGSFLLLALLRARAMLHRRVDRCILDEDGIHVGPYDWPWSAVRRLYAEGWPTEPSVDLLFLPVRRWTPEPLPLRPRLTPREYEALIDTLRRHLQPRYPNLELGGYQLPTGD